MRLLENITMKRESKSFVDALHAVLVPAGLFSGPKYVLSGLTGMAFKFSVHERLLPMSVSAYGQWGQEHAPGIDNLGLFTAYDAGRVRYDSFSNYQQGALAMVKESLDRGVGVIYWLPEFGVIHGYDEKERIIYVQDGWSKEERIVLYDNFGVNETSLWYCQVFGEQVEVDSQQAIIESLRMGLDEWQTPYRLLPDKSIASGKLAYSYLVQGLTSPLHDKSGAQYIINSFITSRRELADYLHHAESIVPDLSAIGDLYEQIASELAAVRLQGRDQEQKQAQGLLIRALWKAEQLEDQAMQQIAQLLARYPDPRRGWLPRWGAHVAR